MADVLRLLRQAWTSEPSSVKEKDDYIIIGDHSFHKSTKTNYIIWGTGKDDTEKDYYKLETVYFLLTNSAQAHTIYVRNAMAENIDVIRRVDRKDILLYLNGKIETTPSIDKTMHFEAVQPAPKKVKPDVDDGNKVAQRKEEEVPKASSDQVLNKGLSSDKIASIKAKYMKQQQKKSDLTTSATKGLTDSEDYFLKPLEEKSCRNRNLITSIASKNFLSNLTTLINLVKRKESSNTKKSEGNKHGMSSSYNRYSQEKFTSNELSEFGIPNVSTGRNIVQTKSIPNSEMKTQPRASQIPIIIVPSKTVSPFVGSGTIKTFLEDFKYNTVNYANETDKSKLYIYRGNSASTTGKPYQVVDQPLNQLSKEDWKRVVCVFVHGPAWQFKNWPFKGGPVEIFQKVKGIYCKWANSQSDKNIDKMNVETFEFNPRSRHSDYMTIKKIWDSIDHFAAKNKPFLDI